MIVFQAEDHPIAVPNMVQSEKAADAESACSSASLNGDITAKRVKEARKKHKSRNRDAAAAAAEAGPSADAGGSLATNRRQSVSKPARDLKIGRAHV